MNNDQKAVIRNQIQIYKLIKFFATFTQVYILSF